MDFVAAVFKGLLSFNHWMVLKEPVTLQKSCISLEARGVRVLGVTTTEEIPTEDKTTQLITI